MGSEVARAEEAVIDEALGMSNAEAYARFRQFVWAAGMKPAKNRNEAIERMWQERARRQIGEVA